MNLALVSSKSRLKYPLLGSSVYHICPVSRGLSSKGLIFEACVDMCVHYRISAFVTLTNSATVNSLCMASKRSQVIWHMMILWCCIISLEPRSGKSGTSGLEVIKLEYILRLKIKRNDWLIVDTCPQAANHYALF